MPVNDHWMYQGRQSHGWFGTGTAPKEGDDDGAVANDLFRPANASQRVDAAAHAVIADVPRNERSRWGYVSSDAGCDRLKTAVAAWYGASAMSRDAFRTQFLNPYTSDETVDGLRRAARGLIEARSYDDLAKAGSDLSTAARQIGADRWPQFIGNAARQAEEAVSQGNVPRVVKASISGTDPSDLVGYVIGGLIIYYAIRGGSQTPKLAFPTMTDPVLMAKPPSDAKDATGAKAPGKPGAAEGFQDPKGGENWASNPNGRGYGWQDSRGNVWIPSGPGDNAHAGPHWNVQSPGGRYKNIHPGGHERPGR